MSDRNLSQRIQEVRLRMPKATEFDTVLRRKLRDLEDEVAALEEPGKCPRCGAPSEIVPAHCPDCWRAQAEALDAAKKALRRFAQPLDVTTFHDDEWDWCNLRVDRSDYAATTEALAKIEALRSGASGKE